MKHARITMALVALLLVAGAAPAQVNLVPNLPTGWGWPVVPRPANDATSTSVPLPTSLAGDATTTWMNSAWRNAGTGTSTTFHNNTILDGERLVVDRSCPALAGGAGGLGYNGGPFSFPGGRHTLELRVDSGNAVSETSETDNNIAHQWVWLPATIAAGTRVSRAAPPDPTGGWSAIPAGQDKYDNCDGVRLATGTGWDALFIWSPDAAVDNQLRFYDPSTGATSGFAAALGASARAGRGVEAVITNAHLGGARSYDVGIERVAGTGNYNAEHVAGQSLTWGDSVTVTFGQDEMLKLFDVTVPAAGPVSAWLQTTTTDPSVALLWADRAVTATGLSALTIGAATDAQGRARLDAEATAAGSHAVVVFRDPDWGTGPRSFGLKVAAARPDLVPYAPAGWHAPLVPREVMVIDGSPISLPDSLPQTAGGPLLYWSARNIGGALCPSSKMQLSIDGADRQVDVSWPLAPGEFEAYYPMFHQRNVAAGRHTLAMDVNYDAAYPEATRANNRYGEQYCWGPPDVASTTFPEQPMYPPDPVGGWDRIGAGNGEVLWYNCAAQRLPKAPATVWWQGYAVKPDGMSWGDYDVQLHERLAGAKNGLGAYLRTSSWGPQQTDYVLVNLNLTTKRPFDVSIVDYSDFGVGSGDFAAQYAESRTLGTAGTLTLAPYVSDTPVADLMQLYEWYFPAGWWMIHLKNLTPWDRYGLALHQANEVYASRPIDAAVSPQPTDDVWLHVQVTSPGWCCLVVFRPDDSAPNLPEYQLSMYPGVSDVPDTPAIPATTALTGAAPNPFNPRVTIGFDLAATGRARLAVFDLKGALVRVLADADLAAGHQEVTWDGRDGDGRALPSGTYVARFEAGGARQTRKLMLLR